MSSIFEAAAPDDELDLEPADRGAGRPRRRVLWAVGAIVVLSIAVAVFWATLDIRAWYIPSPAMEPTLEQNARVVTWSWGDVERGDIVVFDSEPLRLRGNTEQLIKRAVALPGETIEVRDDGRIYIWGPGESAADAQLLEEPYLEIENRRLQPPSMEQSTIIDMWDQNCTNQPRDPGRCTLGPDQLFVLGDNRNASSDSRTFGPISTGSVLSNKHWVFWGG